ncbi:hypothetical protein NDA10_001194 [Ustilago hordei]|uniref:THUMP domain-containing protein n=1 Tax=Ustilago hordei TaxID=120017 RepID=I2G002_USTHO|nr:uncharacterized protein UHO2_03713 [Ustilago hordei]KAJ1044049.1 hypothetical protein NDA10_001194 [Ustilago hordei]CCF52495.1 uncharacterized protein UHOR_04594 [Ustilago hordei]SYW75634.1 related to TAN1 - putative tRNA acetyltransferase [Ustilago hordei]
MPSKRKRSGPGFNRDAPNNSTFKRSKPAYNQVYRLSARNISGPGIFVTCVQGKERKAALQLIDLLNEVADRLYPEVKPEPLPETNNAGSSKVEENGGEEQDMDALRNGSVPQPTEQPREPVVATVEIKGKEKQEDDIAAQIAAELKDIKSSERRRPSTNSMRFKNIETDTECFLFISISPPFDPYLLIYTILSDVEVSGEPGSRFVQRLTPVTQTCSANAEDLTTLARTILPHFFSTNAEEAKSFKIDPRIRSHSKLKRNDVIQIVASNIPTGAEGERIHNANLSNPDLWIVVEVVKNSAAISVVRNYERYRKMNLQSVALVANEGKAKEHEEGKRSGEGRVGASLVGKSAPATTVEGAEEKKEQKGDEKEAPAATTTEEVSQAQQDEQKPSEEAAAEQDQMANFKLF